MKKSKKYQEVAKKVDKSKSYDLDEATKLVKDISYASFDATVEIRIQLNLKEKQKKESIRGSVVLPNTFGDEKVIVVLADGSDQKAAKEAGADFVGLDDIIKKIEDGWTDFDLLIATPSVMAKVAKLGKYIGKQGLMPNPKNGTVAEDVKKAVEGFKSGKANFKMTDGGMFQFKVAKVGMKPEEIKANIVTFVSTIHGEVKRFGENVLKQITISPTMGPSIKLDLNSVKSEL